MSMTWSPWKILRHSVEEGCVWPIVAADMDSQHDCSDPAAYGKPYINFNQICGLAVKGGSRSVHALLAFRTGTMSTSVFLSLTTSLH